jgi:hypothetical protein
VAVRLCYGLCYVCAVVYVSTMCGAGCLWRLCDVTVAGGGRCGIGGCAVMGFCMQPEVLRCVYDVV